MQFKKSLGQHFLIDNNIKKKIVDILSVEKKDIVVEIGPGEGALTELIYNNCKKLILVEKDIRLKNYLEQKFPKAKIFINDFLTWNFNELKDVKIIGNLPYNVSTQIIFKLLEEKSKWKYGVFMVQKEVAERIMAKTDTKEYSILSVVCQTFCKVEKKFDVSPECFIPKPKVFSSIIKLIPYNDNEIRNFKEFLTFTKALFYGRRKKLINSLKKNPFLKFNEEFINFVKRKYGENIRIQNMDIQKINELYKIKF